MHRSRAVGSALAALVATLAALAVPSGPIAASEPSVSVSSPGAAHAGVATGILVTLHGSVSAVDGRALVAPSVAEVLGVAPVGSGTGLRPVDLRNGAAFGAYGLSPRNGRTQFYLVVVPVRSGHVAIRVVIDRAADAAGNAVDQFSRSMSSIATVAVDHSTRTFSAPAVAPRPSAPRAAGAPRDLDDNGRINGADADIARAGWYQARETGHICSASPSRDPAGDANGDGCTDILDVQAEAAAPHAIIRHRAGLHRDATSSSPTTFVVKSAADTPDAAIGNGVCADASGRCTLRAAIGEVNAHSGDYRIAFGIPAPAPVTIQLGTRLPVLSNRSGTLLIDGYSQSGASKNTLAHGTNAIPGIDLRGNGYDAKEVGLYVTGGGITIQGLLIDNFWRGIFMDGSSATNNSILGNFIGFTKTGDLADWAEDDIVLNVGANNNRVGSPDPGDRNVIGNAKNGLNYWGQGVDHNVAQNNIFCISPTGAPATCGTGIDHNFGVKYNLDGGMAAGDANVIGPSYMQGVEYSHGWNPADQPRQDQATMYHIIGNKLIGNWIGFKWDGSYADAYSSSQNIPAADNGQAVNVWDGSDSTTVANNYIASLYDGVTVQWNNSDNNVVRGNRMGISPLGQNAPSQGWGVKFNWQASTGSVQSNIIRNFAKGGVGLIDNDQNVTISRNLVARTPALAIDLQNSSNSGSNPPLIATATTTVVAGTGAAGAVIEVYKATGGAGGSGLPSRFLGRSTASSTGTWSVTVSGLAAGSLVTALQTLTDHASSELGPTVAVTGGTPPPPADLARDTFDRTVTNGWGSATTGGAWGLQGSSSDYAVASGTGRVSTAAGVSRQGLLSIATRNVTVSGNLSFAKVPAGGNAYAYLVARSNGSSSYRAAIRVATNGAVYLSLRSVVNGKETLTGTEAAIGLNAGSGASLGFRLTVNGQQVSARVWDASKTEPTTWQVSGTDTTVSAAGAVGILTWTDSTVTNGPIKVLLDTFVADAP